METYRNQEGCYVRKDNWDSNKREGGRKGETAALRGGEQGREGRRGQ